MEFNEQKSQFIADQIEAMKIHLHLVDEEYVRALAAAFRERAGWQGAASVIHPSYDHNRSKLLLKQAEAMTHLCEFIDALKECDHLKRQIERRKLAASGLEQLFI